MYFLVVMRRGRKDSGRDENVQAKKSWWRIHSILQYPIEAGASQEFYHSVSMINMPRLKFYRHDSQEQNRKQI